MYKAVNKTKVIWSYMEALELHTGAPTEHREDSTSCVSGVETKMVTIILKHIDITIYFLQENFKMVFLFLNMRSIV